jgi:WD40 repeat protein
MAALRKAHGDLLKAHREDRDKADVLVPVAEFVRRGEATGALLEADQDRSAAQSLLDYWTTILYRAGDQAITATLADFNPQLGQKALAEEDYPYSGLESATEAVGPPRPLYGRTQAITDCLNKLQANPQHLLVVVGSAGSGRSSLVREGVLPALRDGKLLGSKDWHYFEPIAPGPHPLAALARLITPAGTSDARALQRLRKDQRYFLQRVQALVRRPVVLVVDRLEELFTRCEDEAERRAFAANLRSLVEAPGSPHRVLLICLSSAEDQVARLEGFAGLLQEARYLVPPPDAKSLRDAIERPAELVGLKFEEGLVERIAEDLVGHPAALPLLQFLLRKLWEKREGDRITWDAYDALHRGQVLDHCAEQFYLGLPSSQDQKTVRSLLLRLVRPGILDKELLAVGVRCADLAQPGEDAARVEAVLKQLVAVGLVRIRRGEAEVVHEALVGQWRRLLGWLEQERLKSGTRALLTQGARRWHDKGRDPGYLWRRPQLEEARDLKFADLTPLEQEFLSASQEAEARAARWQRNVAFLLAAAAVLIAFLLGLNLWGFWRALKEETRLTAVATSRGLAAASESLLQEQLRASRGTQLDLALLLSLEAMDPQAEPDEQASGPWYSLLGLRTLASPYQLSVREKVEARSSLFRALEFNPSLRTFLHANPDGQAKPLYALAYSPDSDWLASAGSDGIVFLWRLASPGERPRSLNGHNGAIVRCLAFSRDGRVLASGGLDGKIVLWDPGRGEQFGEPLAQPAGGAAAAVHGLAFNWDGTLLAAGGADGAVRLWDVRTRAPVGNLSGHEDSVNSVAFSEDGETLASGGADKRIFLWDVAGRRVRRVLEGQHENFIQAVAFHPHNNGLLASAGADRRIGLWDIQGGESDYTVVPSEGRAERRGFLTSLAFSPDGQELITGDDDRRVLRWSVLSAEQRRQGKPWLNRVGDPLIAHHDTVWAVAYQPSRGEGKLLASAGGDGKVLLWDVRERPLRKPQLGHGAGITTVSFRPDGRALASGDRGGKVLLWDVQARRPVTALPEGVGEVMALAWSPAGESGLLAAAGKDRAIRLWEARDLANPKPGSSPALTGHQGDVTGLAFSPDGGLLASCGMDKTVCLWRVATGEQLARLLVETSNGFRDVAFAGGPGGPLLAAAGMDGTITLWKVNEPRAPVRDKQTFSLKGLKCVALSPDGQLLAAGSLYSSGMVRFWRLAEDARAEDLVGLHKQAVQHLAFSPDGRLLASTSSDNSVGLWDLAGKKPVRLEGHADWVLGVAFTPDGQLLASVSDDRTIRLWDVQRREQSGDPLNRDGVHAVAFSPIPGSRLLASGHADGAIALWNAADLQQPAAVAPPIPAHAGSVRCLAFAPDGRLLASSGTDRRVMLWDLAAPGRPRALGDLPPQNTAPVCGLAFSPDGTRLAAGDSDSQVCLWDVPGRRALGPVRGSARPSGGFTPEQTLLRDVSLDLRFDLRLRESQKAWGSSVAFRPGGKTLAGAGADNAIYLWDVASGEPVGVPLRGHDDRVWGLAFIRDGTLLVSGGGDKVIRLWDVRDVTAPRQLEPALPGARLGVRAVAFSPDGTLLSSSGVGGKILLWDVAARQRLGWPLAGHADTINSLAFSADNKVLASASADGTVRLWDVSLESWVDRAKRIANRKLTPEERERYVTHRNP